MFILPVLMGQWRLRRAKNTEIELIQYKVDDTDNKDWLPIWAEARTNGVPHDIEESHNPLQRPPQIKSQRLKHIDNLAL